MNLRMLDKEIAEKVLGYKIRISEVGYYFKGESYEYLEDTLWRVIPHYSIDLNYAMKIVEKLGEFQLTFSTGEWTVDQFLPGKGFKRTMDKNKTLPELICLAALERIKAQEEYERNNS